VVVPEKTNGEDDDPGGVIVTQRRPICEHAVFDRSSDDPRVLMHQYQQHVRAHLMAKAAQEARREAWLTNFGGMLAAAVMELARAIINPQQTPQRTIPRGGLGLVPATPVSF
jgi:hypothetical protein